MKKISVSCQWSVAHFVQAVEIDLLASVSSQLCL